MEDAVLKNDEDINNEIIIDDNYILASEIEPYKTKFSKLKEWKTKIKEDKLK